MPRYPDKYRFHVTKNNSSCGHHLQNQAQTIACTVVKYLVDITIEFELMYNVPESAIEVSGVSQSLLNSIF